MKGSRFKIWFCLLLLVFSVFGQTCFFQFIDLDDDVYVRDNPILQLGFTWYSMTWAFTGDLIRDTNRLDYWQPITALSRILDGTLWGKFAGGHHLSNVILHSLNVILLYELLNRLTRRPWRSLVVSVWFAVHPMQVESVAWVTERKDMLFVFFGLLATHFYISHTRTTERSCRYACAAGICFLLGLMSKPMLMPLPLLWVALDIWPLQRTQWNLRDILLSIKGKWTLSIPVIMSYHITMLVSERALDHASRSRLITSIPMNYITYLRRLFLPWDLGLRSAPVIWNPTVTECVGSMILFLVFTILMLRPQSPAYRKSGWMWFLIALTPAVVLTPLGDRFTYWPMIGIGILLAWEIPVLLNRIRLPRMTFIAGAGMMMATSIQQTSYWIDSETLFRHSLHVAKGNWMIWNNLGGTLMREKRYDEAITAFQEALKIKPSYADAKSNLGNSLFLTGHKEEALLKFNEVIQETPDHLGAYFSKARVLASLDRKTEAVLTYQQAAQLRPEVYYSHLEAAKLLIDLKRPYEAILELQAALSMNPTNLQTHLLLGKAHQERGEYEEAIQCYDRAFQINPNDLETVKARQELIKLTANPAPEGSKPISRKRSQ